MAKTRKDVLEKPYLNIDDIKVLMCTSQPKAKRIYELAKERMDPDVYEVYRAVDLEIVLEISKKSYSFLLKQIKNT